MKKHLVLLLNLFLLCSTITAFAQPSDPQVLMMVGTRPVSLNEFKSMYYKNLSKDSLKSQKALDNYLRLFTDFRLKVNAALDASLDTTPSFKQEMKEYRQKLAEPYMRDPDVEAMLVKQAYERMQTDVRASHILIKVGPDASPADTLAAYKKIMDLREKILKKEITFEKAAMDNSEDNFSKVKGGDLGYFTSLEMVYPFESAAYNAKVGDITMPVRTQFGYHIIKVTDKRADGGQVQVAHIMLRTPPHQGQSDSISVNSKIDSIYKLLQQGQSFTDLAKKYSQDATSGRVGGTLPWFGVGRMPAEFEAASFGLKNVGDYTRPIRTSFGWHIIKLIGKKGVPAFDSVKESLSAKVQKDVRSQLSTDALVSKVKTQNVFKEFPEAKKDFYKVVDETFYTGKWTADKAKGLTGAMFSIGSASYSQQDFADFIAHNQQPGENKGGEYAVNALYPKFLKEECLKYENDALERQYPAFAEMLTEYKDGILLFDITDKMVWSKALKDTAGLKKFYEGAKNNYMWPERADASVYTCADAKTSKEVRKMIKDGKSDKDILTDINAKTPKAVSVQSNMFEKKDNPIIDANWKKGTSDDQPKDGKVVFVDVRKIVPPAPKTLDEARGLVTTDYQNYLMAQWLTDLKAKYPVKVDQKVLGLVMAQ
jgi:peptidyl-prolyl cis-trans isomerase SurA